MNLINLILRKNKPQQQSNRKFKIRIATDDNGKVHVYDADTNEILSGISRVGLYVNSRRKAYVELLVKNVDLDITTDEIVINNENTSRND